MVIGHSPAPSNPGEPLKSLPLLTPASLMVEVGCFSRFQSAGALMSYCGLVPSEHSTGGPGKARRGGITKTGNAHLRRILGEASWHYAKRPRPLAQAGPPAEGRQPGAPRDLAQSRAPSVQPLRAPDVQEQA